MSSLDSVEPEFFPKVIKSEAEDMTPVGSSF